MANTVGGGKAVQILEFEGSSFKLNIKALEHILLADHVKDKPVVVVSVVGAFRKGKSFMLSFFLRYLRNIGKDDWLGDSEEALKGFGWRGGRQRHTKGILVWSEVFLVKTSGGEVAVLLMDTQGTFDCETTAEVYTNIFALSAMVSSVLVYNVSQNIQEDDLLHLQLFTEYGLLAQQRTSKQPFQKLLFLVRDWPYAYETSYGAEGGQKILDECLEITKGQGNDLRQLRQRIKSSFSKIACYLMPYPGTKVATTESFDGRLSDIEKEFKRHLLQLVPSVLAPGNLIVKEINGQKVTCRDLVAYFEAYARAFKKGQVPKPHSLFELTVQASNTAALNRAKNLYATKMLQVWKKQDRAERQMLQDHHYRLFDEAKELFESIPKMGGQEYSERYLNILTKEINVIYDKLSKFIGDKSITDKVAFKAAQTILTVAATSAAVGLALVELPVFAIGAGATVAALLTGHVATEVHSHFRNKKRIQQGAEALLTSTNESTGSDLTDVLPGDEMSSSNTEVHPKRFTDSEETTTCSTDANEASPDILEAFARAKEMYKISMEPLYGKASRFLNREWFESHHCLLRKSAEDLFSSTCNEAGVSVSPHLIERLSQDIDELFDNFANQNRDNWGVE